MSRAFSTLTENIELHDVPLHEAHVANDLLPPERYPTHLPSRGTKPSRLRNVLRKALRNRGLQILIGGLIAFILIAITALLGVIVGEKQAPNITPILEVVEVTKTTVVTASVMTTTQFSTVWTNNPTETVTKTSYCLMRGEYHDKGKGWRQYTAAGVYYECLGSSRINNDRDPWATTTTLVTSTKQASPGKTTSG